MKQILIILLVLFWGFSPVYSQPNNAPLKNDLAENIIFTTDRDLYLAGENLWFTADYSLSPSASGQQLSNILYVELYDSKKSSHLRKKFRILDGKVTGMLNIPEELNSGNYFIRAYTQYQRNGFSESFATQLIKIINPSQSLPEKIQIEEDSKVYPEFGFLLANVSNKVVINYGKLKGESILKSWVSDHNNKPVCDVQMINGLGILEFNPLYGMDYLLNTICNADTLTLKLPMIHKQGIGMRSTKTTSGSELMVTIVPQQTEPQNVKFELYSNNFNKIFEKAILLDVEASQVLIPYNILNNGYNYLILRNSLNQVIGIQSHLKLNPDPVNISIVNDQPQYQRRGLINLDIEAPHDFSGNMELSVTVVKKGTLNLTDSAIPDYLFHNPVLVEGYLAQHPFFVKPKSQLIEMLEIIYNNELTNNDELRHSLYNSKHTINWLPEIRDVSVSGFLRDKNTNEAIVNTEVYASVFKTNPQVHFYSTDQNGAFVFSLNNLTETQDVFLTVNKKDNKDREMELLINSDFSTSFPTYNPIDFSIDSAHLTLIEELYVNAQVPKFFKTGSASGPRPANYLPFSFAKPEFSIDLDDYVDNSSLEVIFRELIPYIKVHRSGNNYSLTVTDPIKRNAQIDPLIMVDYITVFDVNELLTIDPSKIQKIDLYTTPFILGAAQLNGVILITTKTDDFGGIKMPPESAFFEYTTISDSYQFDPPVYDTEASIKNRKADFRTLLYWNDAIKPDRHQRISFYASDDCSEYDIVVRGKSSDGRWCYGKGSFVVVK